jgi:hypothetical protein
MSEIRVQKRLTVQRLLEEEAYHKTFTVPMIKVEDFDLTKSGTTVVD